MKKYKLVISENQDNFNPDALRYYRCGHYYSYSYAAARPRAEEQHAITLLEREETACPTQLDIQNTIAPHQKEVF